MLWPFVLLALVGVLLYLPPVQDFVRGKAVGFLRDKTGAEVQLERLALRFPIGITLKGFYVGDQQGDTLLYAGTVRTRAGLRALLNQRIQLSGVELADVRARIVQNADSVFNFDFIVDAFVSGDTTTTVDTDTTGGWDFAIGDATLRNIALHLDLQPSQLGMDMRLGELGIVMDRFSLSPQQYHVRSFSLADTRIDLRTVSGPPTPDTYPELTNPLADLDIRFAELGLSDVAFRMHTTNTGDSLWMAVRQLTVLADSMDLTRQQVALDQLVLDGFRFGTLTARRDTTVRDTTTPPWLAQNDGFRYFTRDWRVKANALRVRDSQFTLHSGTVRQPTSLQDAEHLVLKDIGLELTGLVVNEQRIAAHIVDLAARTGPDGMPVAAAMQLDARPGKITVQDGLLAVQENEVRFELRSDQGELAALYRDPTKVPLRATLRSDLATKKLWPLLATLGLHPPQKLEIDEVLATTIHVSGHMEKIDTLAVDVAGNQGSVVRLLGRATGVTAWPNTTFGLDVERIAMGPGMRQMMHAFAPTGTVLPHELAMQATATGDPGHLRFSINAASDLGTVRGSGQANGWQKNVPDAFTLDLTVDRLRLDRFAGDTAIGPLSAHITGQGDHLNTRSRRALIAVDPQSIRYNGNNFDSLHVELRAEGDSLHATILSEEQVLGIALRAHGPWPEKGDSLKVALELAMDEVRLQPLGLLPHPLNVAGQLDARMAVTSDGHGRLALVGEGLRLNNGQRSFTFQHFNASGINTTDSLGVDLDSDAFTLVYHANVAADSLLPRTTAKIASVLNGDTTFTPIPGRHMELTVSLPRTEWLTGLVVPELQEIQLEQLVARYDSDKDEFHLDLSLPKLVYDSIRVDSLHASIHAVGTDLNGLVRVSEAGRGQFALQGLAVEANTTNDQLHIELRQHDGTVEQYRIGITTYAEENAAILRMDDTFLLAGSEWRSAPDNELRVIGEAVETRDFILMGGRERFELRASPTHLLVILEQFDLGNITDLISTNDSVPLADGALDALIELPQVGHSLLKARLGITGLHVLGTELGDLLVEGAQSAQEHFRFNSSLQHTVNRFNASVDIFTSEQPEIRAKADLAFGDLSFLRPFLADFVSELRGGLDGSMTVRSQGEDMRMDGRLHFNNTVTTLVLTGEPYTLRDETVQFTGTGAHFDAFMMRDEVGNTFRIDGDIDLTGKNAPVLGLRVRTSEFRMIDSGPQKDALFHGTLLAGTDLRITGPAISPMLKGSLSILPGTKFSVVLPGSKVEIVDHAGIVVFTSDLYGNGEETTDDTKALRDSLQARLPGVELDLAIRIDKEAEFAVVLDPTTGDQATFSGSGDLVFRYAPDGEMYLSGPFTVAKGGYTLEFYGLVKKRFDLVPGGTVRWSGDPMRGEMDIKARYTAASAPYPLVAGSGGGVAEADFNRLQQPLPFEVIIGIDGSMARPDITFGIDLPRDLRNSFPQVNNRLDQLAQEGNADERNKQVFGLLVMNSFIQDEGSGGAPSSGIASSAARNSVNGLLTEQMNKLTGKLIKGVDISLGVRTYDQADGQETYQRTSLDYKVSKRMLDDRLSFEVGGSVGVDESQDRVSNVSNTRAAQYAILYDLTRDGRFRIRGFHENAFDLYDGEITNSGVALIFTRDFEENERARAKARTEATRREEEQKARQIEEDDAPHTHPDEQR